MSLVTQTTNLKSLRYGNDRRDNGSSGQPYVTTPIPNGEGPGFGDYDFLLRGGSLLSGAVVKDVSRLTKMMFDLKSPNGFLFIAKQNLLSNSSVNIKATSRNTFIGNNILPLNNGIYLPTSTLAQVAVNPFGGHLLKQGINPTFDTSEAAARGNAGGILSSLIGDSLPLSNPIYFNTVAFNERKGNNLPTSRLIQFLDDKINTYSTSNDNVNLYSYSGGPGSTLGVGNTNILLSRERTGENNPQLKNSGFFNPSINFGYDDFSVFKRKTVNYQGAKIFNGYNLSSIYEDLTSTNLLEGKFKTNNNEGGALQIFPTSVFQTGSFKAQAPDVIKGLENTLDYDGLMDAGSSFSGHLPKITKDFRQSRTNNKGVSSVTYTEFNQRLDGRVNQGSPGEPFITPQTSYVTGRGEALDKINAQPLYKSTNIDTSKPINDLVKFRIGVIDNDNPSLKTYIHFRAFINSMDDSYTSEWGSQKYSGRAENLYNYQGFDRTVNLSWTVVAQSKQELIPMYQKLNYLASVCAPDYSSAGYMRGNLIELTVGGYLFNQVGIMQGITYTIPQESSWEIGINDNSISTKGFDQKRSDKSVKELPFMINVSGFTFKPIHNFVPNIQKNTFSSTKQSGPNVIGPLDKLGDERYIALSNRFNNNYTSEYDPNTGLNIQQDLILT